MSMTLRCPGCSNTLRVKDSVAGRQVKCPRCGQVMLIPGVAKQAPGQVQEAATAPVPTASESDAGAEQRRPCPLCGEMIMASAIKCRFCGELLYLAPHASEPGLRGPASYAVPISTRPALPESIKWAIALYVLSFVLFFLGSLIAAGMDPGEMDEDQAAALLGLVCLALPITIADIVGFVVACCGYSWGAILKVIATALGVVLLAMAIALGMFGCLDLLILGTDVASTILLIVSSSWEYYRKCADYRSARR